MILSSEGPEGATLYLGDMLSVATYYFKELLSCESSYDFHLEDMFFLASEHMDDSTKSSLDD
jgi:hypothetical protein